MAAIGSNTVLGEWTGTFSQSVTLDCSLLGNLKHLQEMIENGNR